MERVPAAQGHALRQATRKLADRDIAADAGGRKGTRAARLRVARRERTGGERGLEIRRSGSAAGRVRWSLPARRVSETQTHQAPANFPAGHKRCRAPAHERARTSARRVIHTSTGAQEQTCRGRARAEMREVRQSQSCPLGGGQTRTRQVPRGCAAPERPSQGQQLATTKSTEPGPRWPAAEAEAAHPVAAPRTRTATPTARPAAALRLAVARQAAQSRRDRARRGRQGCTGPGPA